MCTWGSHEHVHVRLARAQPLYTNLLPGVDLPVLLKLFRAAEVHSALPLVIVGAVLIAAMEYNYQPSQVQVPIIFSI